ncbi:hypothetical protein DFP72DRAFT_1083356 [Ephemerocybe angulata]|uniref:Uncharacterized protein n=1 Tax=Ephemerocybe angulata TaxID=980116 RepID=A0A8H6H852_9AGAR|nr:hypothetical protein DFP72DRAFT_1083356 [Tulosesus angulatus]
MPRTNTRPRRLPARAPSSPSRALPQRSEPTFCSDKLKLAMCAPLPVPPLSSTTMFAPGLWRSGPGAPAFGETGERVPPDALEEYRRKHHFKAPCCLCAIVEEEYTEATIGVVESLPMPHADPDRNRPIMHGEYVASCAKGECGYFVCLERFYTLNGIKVRVYNERDTPLVAEEGRMGAEIHNSVRNGEGLYQVMPDIMRRGSSGAPPHGEPLRRSGEARNPS